MSDVKEILNYVLPFAVSAAHYARNIQSRIATLPSKESDNIFGAALSDADLSVQNFIEVALLARFPELRFYGEEYASSANTKYFKGQSFGGGRELMAFLDPIDGTRLYLDRRDDYMVLFSIFSAARFEGGLAIIPAKNRYYVSIAGEGTFCGSLETAITESQPVRRGELTGLILLGHTADVAPEHFTDRFRVFDALKDYTPTAEFSFGHLLSGAYDAVYTRNAQFIDDAMLCFIAAESGYLLTDGEGAELQSPGAYFDFKYPTLLLAANAEIQREMIGRIRKS